MYQSLYRNLLWPAYETLIKRRHTCGRLNFLEKSQHWERSQLQEFQKRELRALLHHHYTCSPWFREVCDECGITSADCGNREAFLRLPIIGKDDIRANLDRMKADTANGRVFDKATGGSTGEPLHFVHDEESYEWRIAAAFRAYSWAKCDDGRKTAYIWGGPMGDPAVAGSLKERIHQKLQRRLIFNSYHFDEAKMRECYESVRGYNPDGIVGYTNALCSLARFIKKQGFKPFAVEGIVTAAEAVSDDQRELLEGAFGGKVFQTYGSREFMSIAAECEKHEGLHIASENLLVEVIKDGRPAQPGEIGDIVITDLHNYAMPFIRYRIGDRGALKAEACSCGRGLPLMEPVIGRQLDILHTADGREIPGEFFPHLMKEFEAVEHFQIVQKTKKTIDVRLEAEDLSKEQEARMLSEIRKVIGDSTEVRLVYMDEIPVTASGKFRVTISEVGEEDLKDET